MLERLDRERSGQGPSALARSGLTGQAGWRQWLQRIAFVFQALFWHFASGAMDARVGRDGEPAGELNVQGIERQRLAELSISAEQRHEEAAPHIADAALHLALGLRPVRSA